jgi:G3E family GTPase
LIAVHDGALSAAELLALDHIEPEFSSTPMDKWLNIHAFTAQKFTTAPSMNRLALREMTVDAAEGAEVDLNRHDDHIQAHCFTFETPFSAGRFEGWLQLIMQLMGHQLLRVKGIIHLKDHPGPMVIHGVQHIFHPAAFLPAWPDADRHSKLVFITYDIERSTLARTFELFLLESPASSTASGQPQTEIAAGL